MIRYLNENDIRSIGFNWNAIIDTIAITTAVIAEKDFCQPIKPYLRFKDLRNRIIAMPAYLGGQTGIAGIKWIASFPDNIKFNKKRAHSVIILNDANSGEPTCVINTALISAARTAGVTGFVIKKYLQGKTKEQGRFNAGIIGFGPIGQMHLQMLYESFGDGIDTYYLFDLNPVNREQTERSVPGGRIKVAGNWQEVYDNCTLLITCTVSAVRYINAAPCKGALYLNVSLRDFDVEFLRQVDMIIVDDWTEICRENTDIECAHKTYGLSREDVSTIGDLAGENTLLQNLHEKSVMFNPMGMAVYDMAMAKYYLEIAERADKGMMLE